MYSQLTKQNNCEECMHWLKMLSLFDITVQGQQFQCQQTRQSNKTACGGGGSAGVRGGGSLSKIVFVQRLQLDVNWERKKSKKKKTKQTHIHAIEYILHTRTTLWNTLPPSCVTRKCPSWLTSEHHDPPMPGKFPDVPTGSFWHLSECTVWSQKMS